METIKISCVSWYKNDYTIPYEGWNNNLYVEYEGALRAMRLQRLDVKVVNILDGYTECPNGEWTVLMAGIGEVKLPTSSGRLSAKVYRSPEDFEAKRPIDMCNSSNGVNWGFVYWVAACFGVNPDELGVKCEPIVHNGRGQSIKRYRWNGTQPVAETIEMPSKAYYDIRGWHFEQPWQLPVDTYATAEECKDANRVKVVEFGEEQDSKTFTIRAEAVYSRDVEVQAATYEEAVEKVRDSMRRNGFDEEDNNGTQFFNVK